MEIDNDLKYLAETDETYAKGTARLTKHVHDLKHIKGKFIVEHSNMPVSKAEQHFYASEQYKSYQNEFSKLDEMVSIIRNKRATSVTRIEIWRTLEASRRKGNIT